MTIHLSNLSFLPRAGIKGKDLSPWIQARNYEIAAECNRSYLQHDGVLAARLSPGELLLLCNPAEPTTDVMEWYAADATYQCYPVRRQDSHYWFAVKGTRAPELFAKVCGVNLSHEAFENHSVAQTSVARTSAVIVRNDVDDVLNYYLLGDISTLQYMKRCLNDAMREFNGQVID